MSASREKKTRQERGADYLSPKEQKAREAQKANRRTTIIFTVCAALFVLCVAAMAAWNSGVIQRGVAAVSVNGQTYTAADVAYYYYNGRANLLSSSSNGIDSGRSLRDQTYTDGTQTWFDYLADTAVKSLAGTELTAQAARDAGFDGGEAYETTVSESLANLESSAANNGYTVSQYLKALYGPLMTRSVFERNLRTVALAEAYTNAVADVANYSDAELNAAYDADPGAYDMAHYEYALFFTSGSEEDADSDAAAREAAENAIARYNAGESLEAVAEELEGSYADTYAYAGTSDLAAWLFDEARREGDTTVLDYYGIGYWAVVFHGRARADYHTVSVRHILVDDEAAANDVLAQFNAGDRTEDAFAALARENSTDNADDGGLYENVYIGQMVEPFEDWCFDASRQPGDTGIVETSYGYHVMYFVGENSHSYWQELAAGKLAEEWSSGITENVNPEQLGGMKYIDA